MAVAQALGHTLTSRVSRENVPEAWHEADIRRAFRPGTWPYLGFLSITFYATNYSTEHPRIFWLFAALVIAISSARLIIVSCKRLSLQSGSIWRQWLFRLLFASGLIWGVFLAVTLYLYKFLDSPSLLVLVCTAGVTAGAITAYSPRFLLLTPYLLALLLPSLFVEIALGQRMGNGLAALSVLFLFFLFWQGRSLNRLWQEKSQDEALLAEKASELADANEALRRENQERLAAESASTEKSEFLARMSHEIRTPMHGVLGMTYVAMTAECSDEIKQYLADIKTSAESLLGIINDILDFSKIEARKMAIESTPLDLQACIETCVRSLAFEVESKDLKLSVEVSPALPKLIQADPVRLRQVLINLIQNAIKFTQRGEIRIVAEKRFDCTIPELHITVADTGCGIPAEKLQAIFEPFTQADGSTTRQYGGTGLGLAISAQLLELMHGRIYVESTPGEGSTFHVVLPLLEPQKTSTAAHELARAHEA